MVWCATPAFLPLAVQPPREVVAQGQAATQPELSGFGVYRRLMAGLGGLASRRVRPHRLALAVVQVNPDLVAGNLAVPVAPHLNCAFAVAARLCHPRVPPCVCAYISVPH